MKEKINLAVYDSVKYDYTNFWKGREYEHACEVIALRKIYKKIPNGNLFLDMGGSYGRLYEIYKDQFKYKVISDYSMLALQQADKIYNDDHNLFLIASNVYHLPFKTNIFDCGQMVRVFHHLEDHNLALSELKRVLVGDSSFIFEFPNKLHLKNRLKSLTSKSFSNLLRQNKFKVQSDGNPQGKTDGLDCVFYSYSYDEIKTAISNSGFEILDLQSVSILRSQLLKKFIPYNLMVLFEKIYQTLFGNILITPSVFIHVKKPKENLTPPKFNGDIMSIIVCPKCRESLINKDTALECEKCKLKFNKQGRIIDLRYPQYG